MVSRIPRQWGQYSCSAKIFEHVSVVVCLNDVLCIRVVFQVTLCSGVWWESVCSMRVRWSSIISWAWRSRISWRGGFRHRSSSLDLPRASTTLVSLSARGTFGKLKATHNGLSGFFFVLFWFFWWTHENLSMLPLPSEDHQPVTHPVDNS